MPPHFNTSLGDWFPHLKMNQGGRFIGSMILSLAVSTFHVTPRLAADPPAHGPRAPHRSGQVGILQADDLHEALQCLRTLGVSRHGGPDLDRLGKWPLQVDEIQMRTR